MSKREILRYLQEKSPEKFSANQLIDYIALSSQTVFTCLKSMREGGEVNYDLIEINGRKPVRVYFHKNSNDLKEKTDNLFELKQNSNDLKEKTDNLFELKQKHRNINEEDINYFFDLEKDLICFKNDIKEIKLRFEGLKYRPFDKYLRKLIIEELWKEIKEEFKKE